MTIKLKSILEGDYGYYVWSGTYGKDDPRKMKDLTYTKDLKKSIEVSKKLKAKHGNSRALRGLEFQKEFPKAYKQWKSMNESLLKEFTGYSFKAEKPDKANKVIDALQKLGMGIGRGDHTAAVKHLKTFEGGKMFTHVQYHYVQKEKGGDVYFIHQSQHWLREHNVGVTELYVMHQTEEDYIKDKNKKVVGRAAVWTDKLLKGLKRVTVLKFS